MTDNDKIEVEITEEEKAELLRGLPLTDRFNLQTEKPEKAEVLKNFARVQRILQASMDIETSNAGISSYNR
ncbi:hypothetical protein SRRS_43050 [Sporomusa rhizae]|uniref:hypothetical protein n=1 Tax=Sporomusa rhizae TaxID=357999 RepID=UPI00352A13DE